MENTARSPVGQAGQGEIPAEARAVLRIDLAALRGNWARLKAVAVRAECAGVVKADAYGLGLAEVVQALAEEGCRTFFVASLGEGRQVREVQPGAAIYVLDGLLAGAEDHYAGFDLRPVLSSLEEAETWALFCSRIGRRLPAALQLDTGINRLGMPQAEAERLARNPTLLGRFEPTLVMSHLACADDPANSRNEVQRLRFERMRALFPPLPASLANSAGIALGPAFHYDVVRPGIALYGGRAQEGRALQMGRVVGLSARILQVRDVVPGEAVGYGAIWQADRAARIATVGVGYADGYLRALSGVSGRDGAAGFIGAHRAPVVGRISMDLLTLDVTGVPPHLAQRGAWVELIGDRVGIDDLADLAGTIGYEVLTRLGPRAHRIYTHG